MWAPRIELWSSGLEANPFVCCAILSAFRLTAFLLRLSNQQLPGIHGSHITKNNQRPAGLESLFHSLFVAGASKLWGFSDSPGTQILCLCPSGGTKGLHHTYEAFTFWWICCVCRPYHDLFLVTGEGKKNRHCCQAATSHMCLLSTQSMALQLWNWYLSICLSMSSVCLSVCLCTGMFVGGTFPPFSVLETEERLNWVSLAV